MGATVQPFSRSPSEPADVAAAQPCLAAVLRDLGHACAGVCRTAAEELGAQVWFARRRPAQGRRRATALVVVDTSAYVGSVSRSHQLLHQINDCAKADRILVMARRAGDAGLALAVAARSPHELSWERPDGPCEGCRRGPRPAP